MKSRTRISALADRDYCQSLTVAVVVPTYRRPDCLRRCLSAIGTQTRVPDRIVAVTRLTDQPTHRELERLAESGLSFDTIVVETPGQAAAIEAGVTTCLEDVVAHVDDDTEPRSDWLELLMSHYTLDVGGVGGRDVIGGGDDMGTESVVGSITSFGRHVGNHHLGSGPPRDVDVLKNANISLRRELWVIDHRLRGAGAQTHLELDLCLRARRLGWRLIYDPALKVDHYPAPRLDGDGRGYRSPSVTRDVSFNAAYAMSKHLPTWQLGPMAAYLLGAGYRSEPGLAAWLLLLIREPRTWRISTVAFLAASAGHVSGLVMGVRVRRER